MAKRSFPLSRVYALLEPGPVVLLTTAGRGRPNIMAMSWHTMLEFEPPLVGCVVSSRNHSHGLLKRSRECVLNIPSVEIAEKVVACGNTSGANVDKFDKFRLTPRSAARVGAPLVEECFANLECRVVDTRMVAKYCSSSSKSLQRGSILRYGIRGRSIISDAAISWLPAKGSG